VTENETQLAEETSRAMRELAGTVTDAPPLQLTARRDALRRRRRRRPSGRWALWGVPLAAAVAVIALAVALVAVRDLPGGRAPRPVGPTYPSAAVPAYYLVPEQTCYEECGPGRLVVVNTHTGGTLTTITPPDGATFMAVSGAADDRTFVADTVRYSVDTAVPEQATWYRITLSPGSSDPATLTRLPIPAGPAGSGVQAIALSASGRELAVTYHLGSAASGSTAGSTVLRIYSTATGRLVHSWSTVARNLFSATPYAVDAQSNSQLRWVDNDRGIAFASTPPRVNGVDGTAAAGDYSAVRVLNVTAGGSDLIADSPVAWYPPTLGMAAGPACAQEPAPMLAANGETVLCASSPAHAAGNGASSPATWTFTWLGWETAPKADRVRYQARVTGRPGLNGGPAASVLWASASATTMIIAWTVDDADNAVTHVGMVNDGAFTRLPAPLPQAAYRLFDASSGIAW